jgi:hypothetical protein
VGEFESVFDNGTVGRYSAGGELLSLTNADGGAEYVPPEDGSPIVKQFVDLFNYGARAALDARFRSNAQGAAAAPALTPAQPGAPRTVASWQRYLPYLLLAGGALVAVKLLRR